MSNVTVRYVQENDREAWTSLFTGYRDFYNKLPCAAVVETVWGWIIDPEHSTRSLIAEVNGTALGIGNFRPYARSISADKVLYLDDLFTSPAARGQGVASAILRKLSQIAQDEDAALIRWVTQDNNEPARRLYDQVANLTPWVTYDLARGA